MTDGVSNSSVKRKSPVDFQKIIERQRTANQKPNTEVYGPIAADDRDSLQSLSSAPISEMRILEQGREYELGPQILKECQSDAKVMQFLRAASGQGFKNAQNFNIYHPILELFLTQGTLNDFKLLSRQSAGGQDWHVYESKKHDGATHILIAPSHVDNAANSEKNPKNVIPIPDPILLLTLDTQDIPHQLIKFDRGRVLVANLHPNTAIQIKSTISTFNLLEGAPKSQEHARWLYPRHAQSFYKQGVAIQHGINLEEMMKRDGNFNKFISPNPDQHDESQTFNDVTFQTIDGFKLKSGLRFKDPKKEEYITERLNGKDFRVFIGDEDVDLWKNLLYSTESMIADHLDMPVLTISKVDEDGYITDADLKEPFEAGDYVSEMFLNQLGGGFR